MAGMVLVGIASPLLAQENAHEAATAAQPAAPPAPRGVRVPSGYAAFPVDPAKVARGKTLFAASCASCHAIDLRGSDSGPNLRRSTYQLNDLGNGKMVGVVVRELLGHKGQFLNLSDADAADITQYLKSFPPMSQGGAEIGVPAKFELGDAARGRTYFTSNCATCHAVTAGAASTAPNLAGIATRITDPKALQQGWLSPRTTKVTTAVVTLKDGSKVEGPVGAPSEFTITLTANGAQRVIKRSDAAKIEMNYPLIGHSKLLSTITDTNIHDVTGYLATLK
ncbi:MAG: hypothetical protein BGN86_06510 [Caulobacterales bacterium 68-7]|nr:MAG: hypothetical protein BGN86_06510 [Caulobacterales bacterium 68-7]